MGIGEMRRVDWQVLLTKDSTIVFASELADFNFLPDACNRRNDSIQARCRGINLLSSWSVSLVPSARHVRSASGIRDTLVTSTQLCFATNSYAAPANISQDFVVAYITHHTVTPRY